MSGDSVPFTLSASAFSTGSTEATKLFEELRKPLLRYLVCLGFRRTKHKTLSQDCFSDFASPLESGNAQENIRSWLFRVAHNQARNRQTSYQRRFATPLDGSLR